MTLGVVGPCDRVVPAQHITDIPVVFTMVAAPTLAKIVQDMKSGGRNVTGVTHVGPTDAQVRAMAQYRAFKTLGVLYTASRGQHPGGNAQARLVPDPHCRRPSG